METITYWVGDVPTPLTIDVLGSKGQSVNLFAGITNYEVVLQHNNSTVDAKSITLDTSAAALGRFIVTWPSESLFTQRGEYLLQLKFSGPGRKESTNAQVIKVKELGRD
jgi:hypothetical protein